MIRIPTLLLTVTVALVACSKSEPPPPPPAPITVQGKRIDVTADGNGFTPKEITVKKGEATTLVFTRTSKDTCATDIVFPELDVKQPLPLNQAVAVVVPTDRDRTLTFTCGMGMYKSKVVVQ